MAFAHWMNFEHELYVCCDNTTHSHLELCPPGEPLEAALLTPDVVGSEAVVPASLDVEAGQVHPELRPRSLKSEPELIF